MKNASLLRARSSRTSRFAPNSMASAISCALAPLLFFAACATSPPKSSPLLNPALSWHGDNRQQLERLISDYGRGSANDAEAKKPVAVFDWDNTVIKGDVGDAVLFWMLAHDLIRKPKSWDATSPLLTPDALKALERDCPLDFPAARSGRSLRTTRLDACTDAILAIYDGTVPGSKAPAWSENINKDTIEPAYAWAVQLMAGYTPAEIRKIAGDAIRFNLSNPVSAQQTIGTSQRAAGIRIYEQIADLIRAMQKGGFDVWIASASSQYVVEVFADRVGIAADHVIGVRSALDRQGRITAGFEACGPYASGNHEIISYRQGKRCWINQVVFAGREGSRIDALNPQSTMGHASPIAFAAGDSDTDVFFMRDASRLRLAINRNKRELMCRAYAQDGGAWLINPMFIEPKPRLTSGYRCAEFGLPDQEDGTFGGQ